MLILLLLGMAAGGAVVGECLAQERVVHSSTHSDYRKATNAESCQQQRAGHPRSIAWYAKFTETGHHSYGWVGGGALFHKGEAPYCHEGTWGRDYHLFSIDKVWLGWSHGRRYQGGGGAYKADGPKLHLHRE